MKRKVEWKYLNKQMQAAFIVKMVAEGFDVDGKLLTADEHLEYWGSNDEYMWGFEDEDAAVVNFFARDDINDEQQLIDTLEDFNIRVDGISFGHDDVCQVPVFILTASKSEFPDNDETELDDPMVYRLVCAAVEEHLIEQGDFQITYKEKHGFKAACKYDPKYETDYHTTKLIALLAALESVGDRA